MHKNKRNRHETRITQAWNKHITTTDVPASKQKILIVKSKERKILARPMLNLTKPWQLSKTTYFHSKVDKVVRFLEDDDCVDDRWWIMVMVLVFHEHLFTKFQSKPGKSDCSVASQNNNWRVKAQTWKSLCFPCGQVDKPYSHQYTHPLSCSTTGGGCHRKGGGFSGLNNKPYTDGQPYLTTIYWSGFLNKFFRLDEMNNPQKRKFRFVSLLAHTSQDKFCNLIHEHCRDTSCKQQILLVKPFWILFQNNF